MMWDVAVIGAGIAGLTAARQLHRAGYRVLVLEKSRGLGGRLATRRVEGQPIDHGCRFINPFRDDPSGIIPALLAANILQSWHPTIFELDASGNLHLQRQADTYYVAPAGMTGIAKFLGAALTIHRQRRVTQLNYKDDGWQVQAETPQGMVESVDSKVVVAAIPAPQLLPLVSQVEPKFDVTELVHQLNAVKFDPVITVMAEYGGAAEGLENSTLPAPTDLADPGWMVFGRGHEVIRWAGLDSSKRPVPAKPIVVIHSTPAFAKSYLQAEDLSLAGRALIAAAAPALGDWVHPPTWIQTHRWRYGFLEQALRHQNGTLTALPDFVACGDWCIGSNIEAAFHSGQKAANEIMQRLV